MMMYTDIHLNQDTYISIYIENILHVHIHVHVSVACMLADFKSEGFPLPVHPTCQPPQAVYLKLLHHSADVQYAPELQETAHSEYT